MDCEVVVVSDANTNQLMENERERICFKLKYTVYDHSILEDAIISYDDLPHNSKITGVVIVAPN